MTKKGCCLDVECEEDADCVKRCMMMVIEGTRWWGGQKRLDGIVSEGSFGLYQEYAEIKTDKE